ncbi:hypothetical protein M3Y97_00701700 [Aphelenchoides bicaudatus]|nr:hypothetical protein M3Y97_00701700 [Aphelenchoides bicaudatus]
MATNHEKIFNNLLEAEITQREMKKVDCMIIVLMFFIQNKSIEGRFALVRALERYKGDAIFLLLAKTADALADQDFETALSELHDLQLIPALAPYLIELKNRVLARRLRQILRAYSSISFEGLCKTLGSANQGDNVQAFLQQIQWPLGEDQFVEPKDTEAYCQFIQNSFNAQFGPEFVLNPKPSAPSDYNGLSMNTLQDLMNYAELLEQEVELPKEIISAFSNELPFKRR